MMLPVNPLLLPIIITGFIFITTTIFIIIFWKEIDSFFHPQNYCKVEILEKDNNTRSFLQKKDADLQFVFNQGLYNMFEVVQTNDPANPRKVFTSVYREGRLAKLFYIEGEQNPLDFRNVRVMNDAQQSKQIENIQISRLIHSNNSLANELWNKYGFFIVIIGVLVLLFIAWKVSNPATPVSTPVGEM